ncbi:LPS-assembly protein LptD [Candidatus Sumerlaeota bacterium]|nr:LPS-assembly protein LptD [Candidatus Sumerlaeota bacterium]
MTAFSWQKTGIVSQIARIVIVLIIMGTLCDVFPEETNTTLPLPAKEKEIVIPQVSGMAPENKDGIAVSIPFAPAKKGEQPILRITSQEFLDYDEESNFIYGRTRTRVWYKDVYLEADRLVYDVRLNEVQAYGDIILKTREDEYKADSLWYSMDRGRGYAYGASGRRRHIFIHSDPDEKEIPTFQLLGQTDNYKPREALFRDSSYTTCDFPVPHYRIRCSEILLYPDDRIFLRGAIFYIWNIPVFYLPVYTRSLKESFPWSFYVGYASELGGYVRIAYDYYHQEQEPDIHDEDDWVKKSNGHFSAYMDFFSKRGIGMGGKYKYLFEYDRHRGMIDLYGVSDNKFEIKDYSDPDEIEDVESFKRWIVNVEHRSRISNRLSFQLGIDEMSDPDVYYDLLDRFNETRRNRVPERNVLSALNYQREQYMIRLYFNVRHRIGRDRITNFADPDDNDRDFDIDPFRREEVEEYEGYLRDRYGLVSQRLPQASVSSNYLKLGTLPFYTFTDLNIVNNLDKGLNTVDRDDDAWVRGADLYQGILHRIRLSRNYTFTTRIGFGASSMVREQYDFDYDFPDGTVFPYDLPSEDGGVTFLDEDVFLVGRRHYDDHGNLLTTAEELEDWRRKNLDDVEKYYLYSDLALYLHGRIANYLNGWIRFDIREGTKDSLGEFYESIGNGLSRHDLYNFRLPRRWISSGFHHYLLYPNISSKLDAGYNLQNEKDIYSDEELYFTSLGLKYVNNPETFQLDTSARYSGRQNLDPTDPNETTMDYIYGILNAQYIPRSKFWWTKLTLSSHRTISEGEDSSYSNGFSEYDPELDISGVLGAKIGPKYIVEGRAVFKERIADNGLSYIGALIKRDLHDFLASLMIGFKRDVHKEQYEDGKIGGDMDWDINFTMELKSPFQKSSMGAATIRTLIDVSRDSDEEERDKSLPLFVGP